MAQQKQLGRYELRRVLGSGAMGVVYEGYDPALGRRVAIKTILKSVALDEETERAYAARFALEAKAVARLNHPNIVQVYDFGVQSDAAYLVMEFIQGRELRSFFEARDAFPPAEAVRIMGELLDALDFAHEAGVIHRDVKPANVMLDEQRRVKLADFGVARIDGGSRSTAGTMVGTPAFMSPEQISGVKVDRRTDIFSAGVVLYQLLTGEQPFKGEGAWTVARAIMQDEPPAPSSLVSSVPPPFDVIVGRALAKKASGRYASAKEFAAALRGALEPGAAAAYQASALAAVPRPAPDDATIAMPSPASAGKKKRSFLLPAAIGTLAVVAGVTAYVALHREPAPVSSAPTAAKPALQAVPEVDEAEIRREVMERIRRESAGKSAAEQAAAAADSEKQVQERLAAAKAAADKIAADKATADKAAAEKELAEKLAAAKSAGERAALEKAAADKVAADKVAAEKAAAEKAAAEKAATEKLAAEKAAAEKLAAASAVSNDELLAKFIERHGREAVVAKEPPQVRGAMRGGEIVYVNDGSCGQGRIRQVIQRSGGAFDNSASARDYRCISLDARASPEKPAALPAVADKAAPAGDELLAKFIERHGREKVLAKEPDNVAGAMRAGEVVYVNDGSCGPGRIQEVTGGGSNMASVSLQQRRYRCISLDARASPEKPAAVPTAAGKAGPGHDELLAKFIERHGRDKVVDKEPPKVLGGMREGEVVYANDGSCGLGRIQEVTGGGEGTSATANLRPRRYRCISLTD